jgi:ATP-binding cassette subfamily B protein/ATP-binding cassette subfamily C protein
MSKFEGIKTKYASIKEIFQTQLQTSKMSVFMQFLSALTWTTAPMVMVFYPKIIVDMVTNKDPFDKILFFIVLFAVLALLLDFLKHVFWRIVSVYNEMLANTYLSKIAEKTIHTDYKNIESSSVLELKQKAEKSIWSFAYNSWSIMNGLLGDIIKIATFSYVLVQLNIFVVLFLIGSCFLINWFNMKIIQNDHKFEQEKASEERKVKYIDGLLLDFSIGKEIRLYNAFHFILTKFSNYQNKLLEIIKKQLTSNFNYSLLVTIIGVTQSIVLYAFTMIHFFDGKITAGDCLLFVAATEMLKDTVRDVFGVFQNFNKTALYYDTYKEYLNMQDTLRSTENTDAAINTQQAPVIEFKNVSFQYPNTENYVLHDVSIRIHPEEKLAVVGDNGAGKTTFIKLLLRLYDVDEGEILLNGVNIKNYNYDAYMKLFSPVFQDFKLFAYTIKENIVFNEENPSDTAIRNALKRGNILGTVEKLEHGLDTYLFKNFVEDGVDFSGGEKQRLAIARAFYKDAPVAVLDEPTAALDPVAESEIYEQFNDMVAGKTAIYISHRMSSSRFCDHIAVFENGEIVEYGTHSSLMGKNGAYANMYSLQSKYYE